MPSKSSELTQIDPNDIIKNPANPRLIFRSDELNQLLESIRAVGIKVPLSVYSDNKKYVILDGERRWRCALKLNLKQVPVLIQPKPTELENLLMMFNIHNVRVQWDLMPTALKIKDVKSMLEKENGKPISNKFLAGVTGLSASQVSRCLDLLDLPKKYQDMLLKEAEKPKNEQDISPDLFIETIKSIKAIERHTPEVFEQVTKKDYLESMVSKYNSGVVNNVVKFREVSKLAQSEKKGVSREDVVSTLVRLAKDPVYKIEAAFSDTAEVKYKIKDIDNKANTLIDYLQGFRAGGVPKEVYPVLKKLRNIIDSILRE